MFTLFAIGSVFLIVLFGVIFFAHQYKRCSSDEVLVVFGKTSNGQAAECVHGGGKLIIPLIQDYRYLSLKPFSLDVPLKGALSKNNIRVNVPSSFTLAISTKPEYLVNATSRLLNLDKNQMIVQVQDIILGTLRLVVANMTIEEINTDRDKFLDHVNKNVGEELVKLGLELINVNVHDITDESGYISAIGKRAAAEAIQKANVDVAEQNKLGATGVAQATREQEVTVANRLSETQIGKANAEKTQKVETAALVAQVIAGENAAKASVASTNAELAERENEAKGRIALSAALLAETEAGALRTGLMARANAERDISRAQRDAELAKLEKEQLVQQEVSKRKTEVDADAQAEKTRRIAYGEADAVRARYAAEAEGIQKVLEAKAQGYANLIKAAGNEASSLLMIEKLHDLVGAQAEIMKNIKIDKITVWDSGNNETSNFLQQFGKTVVPFHELAKNAGIELPAYLGSALGDTKKVD